MSDGVLATCNHHGRLRWQLTALLDYPRYRAPFKRAGSYFYFHNPGLLPHGVLYVQHGLGGEPEVLLDPSTLSDDATVSLSMIGVSDDAEHLAYGTSVSGSDWVTIRVMRVRDKQPLHDTISWVSPITNSVRSTLFSSVHAGSAPRHLRLRVPENLV